MSVFFEHYTTFVKERESGQTQKVRPENYFSTILRRGTIPSIN
jgi:hypothetical protein